MIPACTGKADNNVFLSAISKSKKSNPGATVQPARLNVLPGAGSAANQAVAGTTNCNVSPAEISPPSVTIW